MKYKARNGGNGIAVTLPVYIVEQLNIKIGDKLDIKLSGKSIIIKKEEK